MFTKLIISKNLNIINHRCLIQISISNSIIICYLDSNYQLSPFVVVASTLVKLASAIHKVVKYYRCGPKRSSNKIQILKRSSHLGKKKEFNIPNLATDKHLQNTELIFRWVHVHPAAQ